MTYQKRKLINKLKEIEIEQQVSGGGEINEFETSWENILNGSFMSNGPRF